MKKEDVALPLLITRGLILFPNNPQTIEAARGFSVMAIEESKRAFDGLILVVAQKTPDKDDPQLEDIYQIGTLCRISTFTQQKSFVRVKATPLSRVQLSMIYRDDSRGGMWNAKGETLADIEGDHKMEIALVRNIITELESMQDVAVNMPKNLVGQLSKGVSATELSDALANYLPMTIEQKQKILETLDLNERLKLVFTSLKEEKEISDIDKELQDEVRKSAEKNQREYFLREKLKAIRNELGENEADGDSEETILEKLEKNPYPESIKTKVKSELKRYQAMPQASLEASLIKSYIDTLMDVPWYQKTADNDDLENVKHILDEDHYGLDKVKKRIVEYLAVKKMTGNLKAPILCFYGPPGVGKTSLGKSIARALGRKFIKASLGGISDEAEIRGHRRTYVGSMPGRIIAGMKRAGVVNPVFLLDEVDKLSSSYKGDPSSALLEVLDPEQNFAFNDNFLEESYDLSNVLFIATANYIDNVPAPLRDRLELIEVNSYTEIEKIEIATRHLVKKQLLANGLQEKHVTFTKEGIASIIESYTREAGVRELERKIASICRQVVVDLLTQKDIDSVTITPKEVRKYLGIELFENTKKDKVNQVGVVTGLAYTEYGGDILPIEVNHFPGKGRLVLTGNLGDVMKESASIALDYIQANASRYQIDSKIFGTDDIHIHVPEGAVPKDGPSAGIAITTAIISCLTGRPVDNNVAMTGEVTLRGNALPIGGLREKSLAALRSGIKTIIVPQENEKVVHELPEQVRNSIKFVYMKTVDDAVAVALLEKTSD